MNAIDFEYDNKYLSDYGFIICDFNFSNGANEIDSGSKIKFSKISQNNGKRQLLANVQYDECVTATFDICKNPDIYDPDEMEISDEEYRIIMRWLNRKTFLKFQFIDEDKSRDLCYYNASFNLSKLYINNILCGIRLNLETDSPFGYGIEKTFKLIFDENNSEAVIEDISDEIGFIYPEVEIICNGNGTLSLKNITRSCNTEIKNCSSGEVIKLLGNTNVITSSISGRDIANDFNFDFFKIGNTIENRNNKIIATLPCSVLIKYSPFIKSVL